MKPTETDLRLAEIRTFHAGGYLAKLLPKTGPPAIALKALERAQADINWLLLLVESLSRDLLLARSAMASPDAGTLDEMSDDPPDEMPAAESSDVPCPVCLGTARVSTGRPDETKRCDTCGGAGQVDPEYAARLLRMPR